MSALQQDVRAARTSLHSALAPLRIELAVWARLLYKNKNQHRRGVYFRRMQHVRRAFVAATPLLDALDSALDAFAEQPKAAQVRTHRKRNTRTRKSSVARRRSVCGITHFSDRP